MKTEFCFDLDEYRIFVKVDHPVYVDHDHRQWVVEDIIGIINDNLFGCKDGNCVVTSFPFCILAGHAQKIKFRFPDNPALGTIFWEADYANSKESSGIGSFDIWD